MAGGGDGDDGTNEKSITAEHTESKAMKGKTRILIRTMSAAGEQAHGARREIEHRAEHGDPIAREALGMAGRRKVMSSGEIERRRNARRIELDKAKAAAARKERGRERREQRAQKANGQKAA